MKKIKFWLPVVIWMLVIFIFSSRQKVAVTDSYALSFLFFKTLHLIEYAFLYILLYRALKNTTKAKKHPIFIYALIILILYAGTDELHQSFIPTREGKLRDVIIDTIGGGLGWIFLQELLPKAPEKLKNLIIK